MNVVILNDFQSFLAGKGFQEIVALRGQVDFQGVHDIRLIVTDQNIVHWCGTPFLSFSVSIITEAALRKKRRIY